MPYGDSLIRERRSVSFHSSCRIKAALSWARFSEHKNISELIRIENTMQKKLLGILGCPKCQGDFICESADTDTSGDIVTGHLKCKSCDQQYPINSGSPRFVDSTNYANSFGFQWNLFKYEQIDGNENEDLSEKRFYSETAWTDEWLKGKWILDAGCGAGRFLDIASRSSCEVVGVDISNAVDAAAITMQGRRNIHLLQASIYELPFKKAAFDACYSIGVIQHTPDPSKAIRSLPPFLKKGGSIALAMYERKPWTLFNAKYLIRPFTKRINKRLLLFCIKAVMPVCYPLTALLFHIPGLGRVFKFIVPIAYYPYVPGFSLRQHYACVILDTFDMLSPKHDSPQRCSDVETVLSESRINNIQRLDNYGVNLIGQRA